MRKLLFLIIFFAAFGFFFAGDALASLSCQVRAGSCPAGETAIFKMLDTTNAHAELPSQTNYNYSVCCGGVAGLGNSCGGNYAVALKLSAVTNAHVEKNTYSNYASSACLSAPSPVTCSYSSDCSALGSGYSCLASISGDTNAHIGDCSAYPTKVCCAITLSSVCQNHNVWGYAWSENIGWISFNSKNCDANNDGKSDGVPTGCPAAGTSIPNYGVSINSSGNFFGYAWSENIGWIDFAPAGPYPSAPNYSACLDLRGAGQVCDGIGNYNAGGWVRALSYGGGWDGWIKLRGANYGVSVDEDTGSFSGYAWSDMVIGWVKFNGTNYGVTTSLLFNQPPAKPTKAEETTWDNCTFQDKSIPTFHWTYSDPESDPQTAYEIEVDDNSSFSVPMFNNLVNAAATAYALNLDQDDEGDWPSELNWNATYFWRVRVKDDHNNWSEWSSSQQFKTPKEAYPYPGFSWDPQEPNQKEVVVFTPDQTGLDEYAWTINRDTGTGYQFVDGTDIFDEEPHIKFLTFDNTVELKVTDADGYSCESPEPIEITANLPLPEYKETAPIIWLKKILAGLYNAIFF